MGEDELISSLILRICLLGGIFSILASSSG
jgi:hypothetical protein